MNVVRTEIPDVLVLEPKVFGDERGFFMESFNQSVFENIIGRKVDFIQDNHSKSKQGVLRGLHYQTSPFAQAKLVRCIVGSVFDVAVDIRPESEYFSKWVGVELSAKNKRQLWIPEGFAHGFLVLTSEAEFVYKTNNIYSQAHERSIRWDDPRIGVKWPLQNPPILSAKDKNADNLNGIQR